MEAEEMHIDKNTAYAIQDVSLIVVLFLSTYQTKKLNTIKHYFKRSHLSITNEINSKKMRKGTA